jgi:hypothetical protein
MSAATTSAGKRSPIAAQVCFFASAAFVLLLVALHFLRPDLDPSWRFISEYELGDYAWMMRLAFFALALSCVSLVVAIAGQVRGIVGYLGLGLIVLAAAGMALAGVYAPDRDNPLHEVGAILDHLPFAALFVTWGLLRNPNWLRFRSTLLTTGGLPLLGLAIFVLSMIIMLPRNNGQPGPAVLVGWPNRIMILTHCAWLMPVAWCASIVHRKLSPPHSSSTSPRFESGHSPSHH